MPPGGWARRRGRRPGARRSHARPRAAAVRAREAPSGAPRVARRGPAADNALPRATSRAAARQTPARRPPPRAGPSAPRPAPPGFPLVCQGAVALSAGLLPARPSPPLPLSSPALPAGPLAPFSGLLHPIFASLLIGSFPPHKATGEHLQPQHPVTAGLAGRVREGTPQLGSQENFLKLDRVAAHNLNPFPARPLFTSTQTALGFSHLTKQGTASELRVSLYIFSLSGAQIVSQGIRSLFSQHLSLIPQTDYHVSFLFPAVSSECEREGEIRRRAG